MKVERIADAAREAQLEAFALRHGLSFCRQQWAAHFPAARFLRFGVFSANGELAGCFVAYAYRRFGLQFLITPPYTPHISLFWENPAESVVKRQGYDKEVLTAVADFLAGFPADVVELQLPRTVTDTQPFSWKAMDVRIRHTYLLDLRRSESELLANLSSSRRQNLNKAAAEGLTVAPATAGDLLGISTASLSAAGVLKNVTVLNAILKDADAQIAFVVQQGGKACAASFCVGWNTTAIYLFGGAQRNGVTGAGTVAMWNAMLAAKAKGYEYFDFEGSMVPGIEKYYREFGGTLTPFYEIHKRSVFGGVYSFSKRMLAAFTKRRPA